MFTRFKSYIDEKKIRQNVYIISVILFLTVLTLIAYAIPAVRSTAQINSIIPVTLQIISYVVALLYIVFCFVCRFKQYGHTLRALFFYQFPAVFFFIIVLGIQIAGNPSANGFFLHCFNAWTILARPFAHLITPFVGMSELFTKLLVYMISILISASCYISMKKDIAFREKIDEKHRMENK